MNKLFEGFKYIRAYLDDLLVLTTGDWADHLTKLEQVLMKLQEKGLKLNVKKSSFSQSEMDYFGFCITRDSVRPKEKN